jgi:hypothetical protein
MMFAFWFFMASGLAIGLFSPTLMHCPNGTFEKAVFALGAPALMPLAVGSMLAHGQVCKEKK